MKSWQFITPTPLSCPVQPAPRIYNVHHFTGGSRSSVGRNFSHIRVHRRQGRSSLTGNGDKLFQSFSSFLRVFLQRRLQWRGGYDRVTGRLWRDDKDGGFGSFFSPVAFQVTVEKLIRWWFFDRIRSRLMETWFPASYLRTWFRLILKLRSNEISFYKLFLSG